MAKIVAKPLRYKIVEHPKTLGDKIKNRRIELQLTQTYVARILGIHVDTLRFWEINKVKPIVKWYPKIINFLGYIPFDFKQTTIGSSIKKIRYLHGLSQKELAKQIGVNSSTIFHYENNKHKPSTKIMKRLNSFFSNSLQYSGFEDKLRETKSEATGRRVLKMS